MFFSPKGSQMCCIRKSCSPNKYYLIDLCLLVPFQNLSSLIWHLSKLILAYKKQFVHYQRTKGASILNLYFHCNRNREKYSYIIVNLVFPHFGFWSGNFFLIATFPDHCLLVPFYLHVLHFPMRIIKSHDLETTPMGGATLFFSSSESETSGFQSL